MGTASSAQRTLSREEEEELPGRCGGQIRVIPWAPPPGYSCSGRSEDGGGAPPRYRFTLALPLQMLHTWSSSAGSA